MRTEVYSWRLAPELKSELERVAHIRKVPVSAVLEDAVREWLTQNASDTAGNEEQRVLQEAAGKCIGVIAGRNSRRAENARQAVRERLGKQRER